MHSPPCSRAAVSIAAAVLLLAGAPPAAAQGLVEYGVEFMPLPVGYNASTARGVSDGDWDRPIIVGTVENAPCKAACWMRVSQQYEAIVLPGLDPNMDSAANAVVHVPAGLGEWTLVVGSSTNGTAGKVPVKWDIQPNKPVDVVPLPALNAGTGEARAIFKPDGVPLRALIGGWADEIPPMAAGDAPQMGLRVPMIWETTAAGERILRPEFGVGLDGHVNDIGSAGSDGYVAFGGGQSPAGGWMPQMWTSTDDGETWVNEQLPLPMNMVTAEATGFDYEPGTLLVAGWGQNAAGMIFPVVWERASPPTMWTIHELPLPVGADGAQGGAVRKRPGRVKYSNITLKQGVAAMTLWVDDGTGWTALSPVDYLVDPQVGTPIAPGFLNKKFDAIATTVTSTSGGGFNGPAALDTLAAILTPTTLTGVQDRTPSLIAVSAAPNPFNPGVRINYTLPREGRVGVTIYDATGAVVTRFDEGRVPAGEARAVFWDGRMPNGARAASGVYFVRVATPYDLATVKIVRVE
ncbi:MAG: T9SS type A sorting domain-containing protein [Candidatus Krumholzibacteria bacterium]|nr:T9SS type A sorting domain-containing protein [Candidatus Krumholzibacteria bacterium]MDH4337430.1 T9SS type A sorting domain-containing protein [Candidatus Krumholzibacteria bacterium]MDH5271121.1 T9SS type A sorting domain-containing protein [Candidatus Krumholzibacteria bacterium]